MSNVFCLTGSDGRLLDPAVQATVLAKYSRSPLSAKEILSSMTAEESNKFHDKWVVGYGHSSVAELATVPVCIEGLSIVASKIVETAQRGAYSEKSTRYQRFSSESFVTPPGGSATMKAFASKLYETYDRLHAPMVRRCAILMGRDPNDPKSLDRVVQARAFDNLRYLLPAGTGTNVACVLNFRDARDLISNMLGHSNPEARQIGQQMLDVVSEVSPALMRHAKANTFEPRVQSLGPVSEQFDPEHPNWCVDLTTRLIGTRVEKDFARMVEQRYGMDWGMFCKHMAARPEHSEVPDAFKTVTLTFDLMMDFGAFRDLQRHRRCEQFVEPLTAQYGYLVPDDIAGSELEPEYTAAMDYVTTYDDEAAYDADLAQYVIPLGYLHRSSFQLTLKELYYMVELRTTPKGHISYRRVAHKMYELAKDELPELMQWCRACQPLFIGEHR